MGYMKKLGINQPVNFYGFISESDYDKNYFGEINLNDNFEIYKKTCD